MSRGKGADICVVGGTFLGGFSACGLGVLTWFVQEYEARETPEAKLVKDLDRIELVLQAVEYERCERACELILQKLTSNTAQDIRSLAPFYSGSLRTFRSFPRLVLTDNLVAHLHHPAVREWAESLLEERRALWESRGLGAEEQKGIEGVRVGSRVDAKTDGNGV